MQKILIVPPSIEKAKNVLLSSFLGWVGGRGMEIKVGKKSVDGSHILR